MKRRPVQEAVLSSAFMATVSWHSVDQVHFCVSHVAPCALGYLVQDVTCQVKTGGVVTEGTVAVHCHTD